MQCFSGVLWARTALTGLQVADLDELALRVHPHRVPRGRVNRPNRTGRSCAAHNCRRTHDDEEEEEEELGSFPGQGDREFYVDEAPALACLRQNRRYRALRAGLGRASAEAGPEHDRGET
ncbi:hypothetical protein GCM10010428_61270 [Actinosynnema pretiosum subsp. pretiosum]